LISAEIQKSLESSRQKLQLKETALLDKKAAFIEEVKRLLPSKFDRAISEIIASNANHVNELTADELRKMKSAIAEERPKAIQKGITALETSDWLWCQSSGVTSGNDPIGYSGVNEQGAIWQSLHNYSKDVETILQRFGLQVEKRMASYSFSPFHLSVPRIYTGTTKERLQEINEGFIIAHEEYCKSKSEVNSLEEQLTRTKAKERYDSV